MDDTSRNREFSVHRRFLRHRHVLRKIIAQLPDFLPGSEKHAHHGMLRHHDKFLLKTAVNRLQNRGKV